MAKQMYESPAETERMMEEICEQENCREALRRVKANKGSPGIDAMSVEDLPRYLVQHWPEVRAQLLTGTYQPQPVKRVEIPKPDGGVRKLGVPTVLDRLIQHAVLQVLQRRWDGNFSDRSYGFRPGRSAHQAVARAQQYIIENMPQTREEKMAMGLALHHVKFVQKYGSAVDRVVEGNKVFCSRPEEFDEWLRIGAPGVVPSELERYLVENPL